MVGNVVERVVKVRLYDRRKHLTLCSHQVKAVSGSLRFFLILGQSKRVILYHKYTYICEILLKKFMLNLQFRFYKKKQRAVINIMCIANISCRI